MKELLLNTVADVTPSNDKLSNTIRLTSKDLTILMTATFSLVGIAISVMFLWNLLKFVYWVCVGSQSNTTASKDFASNSPARIADSKRWFKQAWNDLMAARNDIESDHPAPEWVCFKSQQALEKSLKALLLASSNEKHLSHDVCELAAKTGDGMLYDRARQIQGLVGMTPRMRYPDMLPAPLIPRDVYQLNDAVTVHELTESTIKLIRHKLQTICKDAQL